MDCSSRLCRPELRRDAGVRGNRQEGFARILLPTQEAHRRLPWASPRTMDCGCTPSRGSQISRTFRVSRREELLDGALLCFEIPLSQPEADTHVGYNLRGSAVQRVRLVSPLRYRLLGSSA